MCSDHIHLPPQLFQDLYSSSPSSQPVFLFFIKLKNNLCCLNTLWCVAFHRSMANIPGALGENWLSFSYQQTIEAKYFYTSCHTSISTPKMRHLNLHENSQQAGNLLSTLPVISLGPLLTKQAQSEKWKSFLIEGNKPTNHLYTQKVDEKHLKNEQYWLCKAQKPF